MAFNTDAPRGLTLFQLASARMDWLSARQKTIATNIANADTPDFRAKEVSSFEDFLTSGTVQTRDAQSAWDQSLDGNRVVLEEQMLMATETEESHRLAARLYRKGHDLISIAASK